MTTPTAAALRSVRPGPVFLGLCAAFAAGVALLVTSTPGRNATSVIGALLVVLAGWVLSLTLHEFGHAFTAFRFGDHSAQTRGYLTLNPLKYTHPGLSIGLPLLIIALGGIGFPGGAVYLNEAGFTPEQRTKVSLAGPLANLILGVALCGVLFVLPEQDSLGDVNLRSALAVLAFLQFTALLLNLLPVPGLDGFGAIEPYLSLQARHSAARVAPFGFLIVFVLLYVPFLNSAFFGIVYSVMDVFGVEKGFIAIGWYLFEFWR